MADKKKSKQLKGKKAIEHNNQPKEYTKNDAHDFSKPLGAKNRYKRQGQANFGPYSDGAGEDKCKFDGYEGEEHVALKEQNVLRALRNFSKTLLERNWKEDVVPKTIWELTEKTINEEFEEFEANKQNMNKKHLERYNELLQKVRILDKNYDVISQEYDKLVEEASKLIFNINQDNKIKIQELIAKKEEAWEKMEKILDEKSKLQDEMTKVLRQMGINV